MAQNKTPDSDANSLEQASERLDAFLAQREKIRDGGDTVVAANGCELLLSDLKEVAREVRQLVQDRKASLGLDQGVRAEESTLNLNVALEAYRECRGSDEPSDTRWVEEALLAAIILRNPEMAKLTPREVVPDEMLQVAMDAYTSIRNRGISNDRGWVQAALEAAQAMDGVEERARPARKMSP